MVLQSSLANLCLSAGQLCVYRSVFKPQGACREESFDVSSRRIMDTAVLPPSLPSRCCRGASRGPGLCLASFGAVAIGSLVIATCLAVEGVALLAADQWPIARVMDIRSTFAKCVGLLGLILRLGAGRGAGLFAGLSLEAYVGLEWRSSTGAGGLADLAAAWHARDRSRDTGPGLSSGPSPS